jgi:hypothetical protein
MQVLSVSKSKAPRGILVCLLHLDRENAGRKHDAMLPLPVQDHGISAEFLRGCGLAVKPGGWVSPSMAVGSALKIRSASDRASDER